MVMEDPTVASSSPEGQQGYEKMMSHGSSSSSGGHSNTNNKEEEVSNILNDEMKLKLFDDFFMGGRGGRDENNNNNNNPKFGLHILNSNGIIIWANQTVLDILGYTQTEYIGQSIRKFHRNKDKCDDMLSILSSDDDRKLSNYIVPIQCKDGHIEYMSITSTMRKVKNGFSLCVTSTTTTKNNNQGTSSSSSETANDLVSSEEGSLAAGGGEGCGGEGGGEGGEQTGENTGESSSASSASSSSLSPSGGVNGYHHKELAIMFEDFMEFGSVGLHIVDSTGIIRWANKAEMDLLGYTREEYFGKKVTEVYADGQVLQRLLTTLLSGKKLVRAVTPLWAKDGHVEYVEINSSMRKVNGKCSTTRCFSTVVTDRVLREREELKVKEKEKEAQASKKETKRKTDFLRKLCHELRNPLAGVMGNIELLLSELHPHHHHHHHNHNHNHNQEVTTTTTTTARPAAVVVEEEVVEHLTTTTTTTTTVEQQLIETQRRLTEAESKLSSLQESFTAAIDYAKSAQLAAEHQMLVVNDTLSLSRLETEGSEFSMKPVDVSNIMDSVQAILGVKAHEKSIDFIVSKDGLPVQGRYIRTDPVWLKQILINLVSNALKFTDANSGRVILAVGLQQQQQQQKQNNNNNNKTTNKMEQQEQERPDDTKDPKDDNNNNNTVTLLFTVTDNGIGMTQEEQGRLFGVFAQANERISSQFGGSGLGLYIVKQLLEHIGGTISVVSEKGKGTSFIVEMPCETLSVKERTELITKTTKTKQLPVLPLLNNNKKQQQDDKGEHQQCKTKSSSSTSTKLEKNNKNKTLRVLVVDDSTVNRRMLAAFLRKRGYTHDVAENGAVAFDMHEQSPFDVILTDVDMPVMDGNELTRKLRQKESEEEESSTTPVTIIGISGNSLDDDISSAKKDGMNAYITKPFNFRELESLINKHGCVEE